MSVSLFSFNISRCFYFHFFLDYLFDIWIFSEIYLLFSRHFVSTITFHTILLSLCLHSMLIWFASLQIWQCMWTGQNVAFHCCHIFYSSLKMCFFVYFHLKYFIKLHSAYGNFLFNFFLTDSITFASTDIHEW